MGKTSELYTQGHSLLEKAYKCYMNNNIVEGDKLRSKANALFEQARTQYDLTHTDRNKLYGKNRNFGVCFHILENSISKNMKSKDGKKFISEAIKLIKHNPILKEQFDIYNNLCNKKGVQNTEKYVDCVVECIDKINMSNDSIKNANDKLINLIESNNKVDKFITIDDEHMNLYENIEYILANRLNVNNIEEYNAAKDSIVKHLNTNNLSVNENKTYNENIEELAEKYNFISNDEAKLVEDITSNSTDKEKLFENYKKDTLDKINETIKSATSEDKEQWNSIKEALYETKFDKETMVDDILKFVEIQNSL